MPFSLCLAFHQKRVAQCAKRYPYLAGIASNLTIDKGTLTNDVSKEHLPVIKRSPISLVDVHAVFTRTVVPATCIVRAVAAYKGGRTRCVLLRMKLLTSCRTW